MKMLFRALCCALCFAAFGQAGAQAWPAKPVKMIVATGPGLATEGTGVRKAAVVAGPDEREPGVSGCNG